MSQRLPTDPGAEVSRLIVGTLLAEALEHAKYGVFVYDDEGRYIAVNARGAEILGCDPDELMEHNVSDFAPGAVDPSLLYSDGFRTGSRLIRRQDGQEVEVGYAVAPTRVGHLPHRVAVVWEIAAP